MLAKSIHEERPPPPSEAALTRRTLARIRVVDAGVLTPSKTNASAPRKPEPVAFVVTVEPLRFGVLPASVVPTVLALVVVAVAAAVLVLPVVSMYLNAMADAVKAEITVAQDDKKTT